jgi:hypothetical protein
MPPGYCHNTTQRNAQLDARSLDVAVLQSYCYASECDNLLVTATQSNGKLTFTKTTNFRACR